ncbi:hypothetical protein [Flavobacterium panacagri]|uniref:hypothetical protein n=1 Tax=Flavobacterium panacagri TaxID=3034146 RepID=UPI0025A65813|nr:hypothetical protein [Flavobacterium panacagri]
MTPRNELFVKIKQALKTIPELELVDLQRRQFSNPVSGDPVYWTAALVDIQSISWQNRTGRNQEGDCITEVILYCKNGWTEQLNVTVENPDELAEFNLIQKISEKLQYLRGDLFSPLLQVNEETDNTVDGFLSYKLSFSNTICRKINALYSNKKAS